MLLKQKAASSNPDDLSRLYRLISFQSLESTLDSWRLGIDYFFNRLPALHDTTPLIDREIRKTNRLYLYIAVFLRFHNHRH